MEYTTGIIRLVGIRYPYLPCPICHGLEGCDHTVTERRRAAEARKAHGCPAPGVPPAEVRIVPCETCQTEGRILREQRLPGRETEEIDHGACPVCGGTSSEIVEVQPIEMEEL